MKSVKWGFPAAFAAFAAVALTTAVASGATFVVDSTGDEPDDNTADNLCHTTLNTCTLRAAIMQANATAGADIIHFNIAGGGVHKIQPASGLPFLSDPVTIDGYSQPGASPNTLAVGDNAVLLIEIDGSLAGNAWGLPIFTNACTIKGLVVNRFANIGINIDATGGGLLGGHTIQGNFVGTNPAGTSAAGNTGFGIVVRSPNNLIGGPNPADRNVISGTGNPTFNSFVTNIRIEADFGATITGDVVQGNYIGTDASGTVALSSANGATGIGVWSGTVGQGGVIIGGLTPGAANVISGNSFYGVEILSAPCTATNSNVIVEGNFIGVNRAGNPLGNGQGGIHVGCRVINSTIGGTAAGAGNVIANNGASSSSGGGVVFDSAPPATGVAILGNSIYGNTSNGLSANLGLGIDLGGNGPTANDACDADIGPNNLQNYPILTTAFPPDPSSTTIQGTLNSAASQTYRIEFFANPSCDPSSFGEGQTYLGSTPVTTDATCNGSFSVTFPVSLLPTVRLTATATDPGNNTSEFSSCISLQAQFHTIQPCRVADTRLPIGPYGGPALGTASDRNFVVGGQCGIPATAQAVAFNFAIVQPTSGGHVTVYPAGSPLTISATINYSTGQIRANNAIVPLGPGGDVLVHLGQGAGSTADLVIDVNGYFQ